MSNHLKRLFRIVVTLFCGAILGHLLVYAPIVPIEPKIVFEWSVTFLRTLSIGFTREMQVIFLAVVMFISTAPNVTLVSFLVALSMKVLRKPRLVFCATIMWPVLHYIFDVCRFLSIWLGLGQSGIDSFLTFIMKSEDLHAGAVGMLLAFSLFCVLVLFIYRKLSCTEHTPLNPDTQHSCRMSVRYYIMQFIQKSGR